MENNPSPLRSDSVPRAEIDTTRPFRSVKEAVALFGDRILASELHPNKPNNVEKRPRKSTSSSSSFASVPLSRQEEDEPLVLLDSLKKLEVELEETRREIKQLKERGAETEIAVASLNAELHKSMSKLAQAEATAASKAATEAGVGAGAKGGLVFGGGKEFVEEEKVRSLEHSHSLAEILKLGEKEGYFGSIKERKKMKKKKPIVPLIWDIFSRKKNSGDIYTHLYAASGEYL